MMKRGAQLAGAGLLLCAPLLTAAGVPIALPRPAPQLRHESSPDGAVRRNQACEHCHREIAREWRRSRHRAAYDNSEFQHALSREPAKSREFCVRCHAPEALPGAFDETAALGVACVTCHAPLGPVLAAPGTRKGRAPHAVLRTEGLVNGDACARCHEFAFPAPNHTNKMQRTISEHRAAAGRRVGCHGCHMRRVGRGERRRASHDFPGGHDARLVRSALGIAATRPAVDHVRVRLGPKATTHAIPTGDLFRRISVRVTADGGFEHVRYLARHFRDVGGRREEPADDRVYRSASIVDVFLPPGARTGVARYRVSYQRVARVTPGHERDAELDGEIVLAEGELPPPGK